MATFRDFSVTASANTGSASEGWLRENCAYSEVNDAYREFQAILARDRSDKNGTLVAGGSTSSYVLSVASVISSYADGDYYRFRANVKNAGATTIQVSTLSARPVVKTDFSALTDGDIVAGGIYEVFYHSASACFQLSTGPSPRLPSDVNRYASNQAAADGNNAVYFPEGSYGGSPVDVKTSLYAFGDGDASVVNGGFLISDSASGTITLEIRDMRGVTTGTFVSAEQSGTANLVVDIDNIRIAGATNAVSLRTQGEISGRITGVYATDLTGLGLNVGYNSHAASDGWGPVLISGNIIDGVSASGGAHYGILTYSPYSSVSNNFIRDVGSRDSEGTDTESVYLKARHSVVTGNIIVDGGKGEAFLNLKGDLRGETNDPNGYSVVATGNVFYATPAYASAAPTGGLAAVKLANDTLIFSDAIIDGLNGAGVTQLASELDDNMVANVIITGRSASASFSEGALYLAADGRTHVARNLIIRDVSSYGIRIQGMTTASEIELSDIVVDGTGNYGMYVRPSANNTLSLRAHDLTFRNVSGVNVIRFEDVRTVDESATSTWVASARLENIDLGTGENLIGYEAGTGVTQWYVRNLHARASTTSTTATTVFSLRLAPSKAALVTARFVATDGSTAYAVQRNAAYYNAAGTVGIVGAAVDSISATGSAAYSGSIVVSGQDLLFRVAGKAATTVAWSVSVDAETP